MKKIFELIIAAAAVLCSLQVRAQTATITVDCNVDKGLLFRSEAYNNVSGVNTGAATRDADYAFMNSQGLHAKIQRVWVSEGIYNPATGNYNYTPYISYLNSVSNLLADEILMCVPGNTMVDGWNYTPAQCKPILKNIIKYFKTNWPKIKYVEGLNEPDLYNAGSIMTSAVVYSYYKVFSDVVNEVNAELAPAVPLQVGGITVSSFKFAGNEWIRKFLDDYRNDTDPNKKLDFISYHTYSYKESPKETGDIRATIEQWLTARNLPTTIPSFITETGLFPGAATSGTEADDALRQAAGMAAYVYWETNSPLNIPFNWVMRHAAEVRKDQVVTRPISYSDRLTPYGNSMKMMGMMKEQRIGATSNIMDASGLGIYGLAAKDAGGISILAWNYQHTGVSDYQTNIQVNNLPASFNGMSIRRKTYRIDQSTSNNYYNVNNCNLQLVADTVVANPGSNYTLNAGIISENNMLLFILEPVLPPAATSFGLSVTKQGIGFKLNWHTATESNSYYFEVLRSADGISFTRLANAAAAGNSSTPVAYSFTDAAALPGINYYQVKLLHNDSSRVASGIVNGFISLPDAASNIYYNFGATGSEHGNPTSGVPAGWSASLVVRANAGTAGLTYTSVSPSNTYAGASGAGNATMGAFQGSLNGRTVTYSGTTTNIPATGIASLSYYEVTLTPTAADYVKIKSISFGSRSIGSSGGPANLVIRTSIDNYTANVFTQDVNTGAAWVLVSAAFPGTLTGPVGQPVTIRIYANDAVGGTGYNWRIDDLDIGVTLQPALPQLHTFTASEAPNKTVQLNWQTAFEQNVASFEVMRSTNGTNFSSIGQAVPAGGPATAAQYAFTDVNTVSGINYYQIKQVKTDASFTLSDIAAVYLAQGAVTNIYYNFGPVGGENGAPTSGVPGGWTASDVTAGNTTRTSSFYTSISNTGTYTGASQAGNITLIAGTGSLNGRSVTYGSTTTNIPATGIGSLSYFEVTLNAPASEVIHINRISFGSRSIGSSGGPANVVIRTSADNFTGNVYMQNLNANSAWELIDATLASAVIGMAGSPLTIRMYANDAVGGTANNWRIDDLNISVNSMPVILPVSLISFTAAPQRQTVLVQWRTTAERNIAHYIVERSGNGRAFTRTAQLLPNNMPGEHSYTFTDAAPLPGISYYRLLQTDADGRYNLYGPVMVRQALKPASLLVFAGTGKIFIRLETPAAGNGFVTVTDMHGRKLAARKVMMLNGLNQLELPLTVAAHGMYLVQVQGDGWEASQKILY